MKEEFPIHSAQFFAATIYEFKPALAEDIYKDIIIDSLQFLAREKRIELNAFAPIAIGVSNHLHLIWQPLPDFSSSANRHPL